MHMNGTTVKLYAKLYHRAPHIRYMYKVVVSVFWGETTDTVMC